MCRGICRIVTLGIFVIKLTRMKRRESRGVRVVAQLLILAQLFFVGGGVALAQVSSDTPVVDTGMLTLPDVVSQPDAPLPVSPALPDTATSSPATPDVGTSTSTDPAAVDLQGASSTPALQQTFSDQQTVPPDVASTTDVTLATTTDGTTGDTTTSGDQSGMSTSSASLTDTTTTDGTASSTTTDVLATDSTQPPVDQVPPPQNQDANQNTVVISADELTPKSEYVFSLSGKKTPSERRVRKAHVENAKTVISEVSEVIDAVPAVTADNVRGVMSVTGACESKYYVILVYKNADDYANSPGTYIVNRAFPCVNGTFSYDITDLPNTLEDGNYYLLVGSAGESGPWTPITAVTEITLHRHP
jgi:hypothetical protein